MTLRFLFLSFIFFFQTLQGNFDRLDKTLLTENALIIIDRESAGFFSTFHYILTVCKSYDKGLIRGFKVDFGTTGNYYCPNRGENWWHYYFLPTQFGDMTPPTIQTVYPPNTSLMEIELFTSKIECSHLIKKYLTIRPEIIHFVDTFYKENLLGHFVISVHYRGTDKISEAPHVPYIDILQKIEEVITSINRADFKIFLATDEAPFLEFLRTHFGDAVSFNETAKRSTNGKPLHFGAEDPYQSGLDALIDCLLLSKGDILVRTSSNLSLVSTYFNPDIPVLSLSERYPSSP